MRHGISLAPAAVAAIGLLAGSSAAAESVVDLRGGFGYDSNPLELSQEIGEQDGIYAELEATVRAEGTASGGWTKMADIGVTGQLFESHLSDADQGRIYVRARGDAAEKYDDNGWSWSLRSEARDKTYVSRLTGVEATDDVGNEIGDRYDSLAGDFEAAWRFPGTRFGRAALGGMVTYKNYLEDYDQFGLERLDYLEYGLRPQFEFGRDDSQLRLRMRAEQRNYRDRRVNDANGDPVPGTDLEYRYYGVDARYQLQVARRIQLELTGGYEIREDNGVGYADRTRWDVGVEWNWRFKGRSRLVLDAEYSSRTFDQQVAGDPTVNDESPEKKGFDLRLRYTRPFPFLDIRGFSLVVEAGLESYDNSDDERFAYDRTDGFVGVRQEF